MNAVVASSLQATERERGSKPSACLGQSTTHGHNVKRPDSQSLDVQKPENSSWFETSAEVASGKVLWLPSMEPEEHLQLIPMFFFG